MASAGRAGQRQVAAAGGLQSVAGFDVRRSWHASTCKNVAHAAGIQDALMGIEGKIMQDNRLRRTIVMNLDCDQVPMTWYWQQVLSRTASQQFDANASAPES